MTPHEKMLADAAEWLKLHKHKLYDESSPNPYPINDDDDESLQQQILREQYEDFKLFNQ